VGADASVTIAAMKSSLLFIFVCSAILFGAVSGGSAQREGVTTGSVQFTARITPAGGVDEPVRSFPFYLLRKSYAEIETEAAAAMPGSDLDSFIDTLEVSKELKAWLKKTHWMNLSGEDFVKKLKPDDIMGVPEFFTAYTTRASTDASLSFPTQKYKLEDKVKDPEKYDRLKKAYYDSVRAFLVAHPKSTEGMDMELEEVNPGHKWDNFRSKDQADLQRQTSELALGSYLAARATTDVDGNGYMRAIPAGTYYLSSLNIPAEAGETRETWDVPVTVSIGHTTYVALSGINSVHRKRAAAATR
jgi:hypothetical protein